MKLKELKDVLRSTTGNIQMAVLWDCEKVEDVSTGSIDYIVKNYGESTVYRIYSDKVAGLVVCVNKAIKSK